jgi:hypothetical protein
LVCLSLINRATPKLPRPDISDEIVPVAIVHDRHIHARPDGYRGPIHFQTPALT